MAFQFENLQVWQKAMKILEVVDRVTKKFPKQEIFVLTSQIKRAADSSALNITERLQGQSKPEFRRFLYFPLRSGFEVVCCIYITKVRKIILKKDFKNLYNRAEEFIKMVQSPQFCKT